MLKNATADWGISEKAAALHSSALVWDDHGGFAYSKPSILAHLERWRAAGIDYLSINAGYDVVPWTETLEAVSK
jgi:membrane dipeptidase